MIIESMNGESSDLRRRAQVHAALGEPARLAIVDALAFGDASPGEIGELLGMPTNLIAHHVKVLAEAGLISRTRSEGDRRRTYLTLVPETLSRILSPPSQEATRVVFVCTHNSARSQLAAALWARRSPIPAASAGTRPAGRVHPRAIRVARRHDLDLSASRTARVGDVVQDDDLVIAVCDQAHEHLSQIPPRQLHWSVPDPAAVDTDDAFETAYTDLAARVDRLAPALVPGAHRG